MKKMIKPLALVILVLITAAGAYAKDRDLYANAPKDVRERISAADKLIEQKQYLSANGALGADDSEYIILKRTELFTNYFVMSMMHQMFSLKNLEEGEDLQKLRYEVSYGSSDMSFATIFWNPMDVISSYAEENGMSPALQLATAHYYYDTLNRYGDQWLESVQDMITKVNENFEASYEAGFYDYRYLNEYAEFLMNCRDDRGACELYEKAVTLVTNDARTWFNYGATLLNTNQTDKAITAIKKAIQYKDPVPEYHLDAYLILIDAYRKKNDTKNAEKTIQSAKKEFPDSALPLVYEGDGYIRDDKVEKATESFKKAYALESTNQTLKSIIDSYFGRRYIDEAIAFCLDTVESQADLENRSMLWYMAFQLQYAKGDRESAEVSITKAEECLAEATDADYARKTFKEIRDSFNF